jgi:hypothetical protein
MTCRSTIVSACLTAAAVAAVAAGCNSDTQPSYGTRPSAPSSMATSATPTMPPADVIPAGARKLSQGTYNQIMFTIPSDGTGSLYLYDTDTMKVVGMTNSVEANANKSMTMADLKNTAQGLNTTDHYQVWFAPSHVTTQPIGGGSGM